MGNTITTEMKHDICIVDNGDYGLAFNRLTGRVLEQYGIEGEVLIVDVEEFALTYGEYPPNEVLNTSLDFGYWYHPKPEVDLHVVYSPPERAFREDFIAANLCEALGFDISLPSEQIRGLEVRPWHYREAPDSDTYLIEECAPEQAQGWGIYGCTTAGPAYHVLDAGNERAAHSLRVLLAPILIQRPRLHDPYLAALQRCEALETLGIDAAKAELSSRS